MKFHLPGLVECGNMTKIMVIVILFVTFSLLFYFLSRGFIKNRITNNRIKAFIPYTPKAADVEDKKQKKKMFQTLLSTFSRAFVGVKFSQQTEKNLEQAGSTIKLEEFFVLRLLSAVGICIFLFLLGLPWYLSLVTLVIGFIIPDLYMKRKGKKRINLLSYQLVESLGTMSNSLRAGFSFGQAMQLIGKEMPDPIGPEFDRVVREIGMGIPMETVFQNLLSRLPNKELEVVIQAILAQQKSGGNLAELFDTMEDTIRGRIRILEELKTLTAQGKMSSWIITALPIVLGFYLNFVNPDFFRPMFAYPLGWALLSIGSVSLVIGWILIQKIVRIEV